ncbi:hypothetical protein [Hamadaea tsunoensis]|uniref:hypothetical protein n=1 Tax=Hamadaea tsunoensis TaxID=53368 RepID=UPI0004148401|nr:hypothetical protein [Hamadaea tsunoensis]
MRIVFALVAAVSVTVAAFCAGRAWLVPSWHNLAGSLTAGLFVARFASFLWRNQFAARDWEPLPGGGFVAPRRPLAVYSSLAGLTLALGLYAAGVGAATTTHPERWLTAATGVFLYPLYAQAALFLRCLRGLPEVAVTPAGMILAGRLRPWERITRVVPAEESMTIEVAERFGRRVVVPVDLSTVPPARTVAVLQHFVRHPEDRVPMTTLPSANVPRLIG